MKRFSQCDNDDSNSLHKKMKHSDTTERYNHVSPFVVTCYGHVITDEDSPTMYYNTIFEYCPNHCLAKHIKSHKGIGLQENDVKGFACDILLGLKYIHGEKIIHRDIKPKNILLRPEGKRIRAKISGFGKAIETESVEYNEGSGLMRGTMRFMCPELLRDNVLDYGADVWAFGCTVLEMLSGERVWGEQSGERVWKDWVTLICESNVLPYVPDSLSEEAKDFVYESLKKDPALRSSVDSLLEHPFLRWKHDEEEEEEEEEEERYDAYEAHEEEEEIYEEEEEEEEEYLQGEEAFGEEQEEIELDEEYPKEDSEEDV